MKLGFIKEAHRRDAENRPAGGETVGTGFVIVWQDGPLRRIGSEERHAPNGAFVEDVIAAAIGRLKFYQDSPFACPENEDALSDLRGALASLDIRTRRRIETGIEGTHEGN